MPGSIEGDGFSLRQPNDPKLDQQFVENQPMKVIEFCPSELATSDAVHARGVLRAPGIREFGAVYAEPLLLCECRYFTSDRAAPIDHSTEYVKHERLYRRKV
jgi:hypothetical protein